MNPFQISREPFAFSLSRHRNLKTHLILFYYSNHELPSELLYSISAPPPPPHLLLLFLKIFMEKPLAPFWIALWSALPIWKQNRKHLKSLTDEGTGGSAVQVLNVINSPNAWTNDDWCLTLACGSCRSLHVQSQRGLERKHGWLRSTFRTHYKTLKT